MATPRRHQRSDEPGVRPGSDPTPLAAAPVLRGSLAIAARDLRGVLLSPWSWSLLAVVQLVVGIVFVVQLQVFLSPPEAAALAAGWGITRVVSAPLFNWAAFLLLLAVPVVTMRALSDEHRTLVLLLSAPVSATAIVIGKYLALLGYLAIAVVLVALLPLLLLAGGALDLGLLGAQVLGLALLAAAFAALGLWMSSLARQPAVAATATFGILLLAWILSWRGPQDDVEGWARWVHYLSWQLHLDPLLRGLVDTADLAYFAIVALASLGACVHRVAELRRGA